MKTKIDEINRNIYDIKDKDNYEFKMKQKQKLKAFLKRKYLYYQAQKIILLTAKTCLINIAKYQIVSKS